MRARSSWEKRYPRSTISKLPQRRVISRYSSDRLRPVVDIISTSRAAA